MSESTEGVWSVPALVREGAGRLGPDARHEAEWLLERLLDAPAAELYLDSRRQVPPDIAQRFFDAIGRRAGGEPLQYLLGQTQFFGRTFEVAPGVFIPRPETEVIVDRAAAALRALHSRLGRPLRLLDLGMGSGCVAVTLACELSACVVVGVELSWTALETARRNARRHRVDTRVRFVQGSWVEPVQGAFDGIVTNPPYVASGQIDRLPPDVRQEPRLSLDGGPDGLDALTHLLAEAPRVLRPGGVFALECGEDQVAGLKRRADDGPWARAAETVHDLAGRPRGLILTRR